MFIDHVAKTQSSFEKLGRWNIRYHWQPCDIFIPQQVDFIGYVENMDKDIKFLSEKLGIDKPISRINESEDRATDYFDQWTDQIVRKVFKKDIKRFGFEKSP